MTIFDCSGLRAARKQARLSQIEVANALGISVTTLSYYENGHKEISAKRLATMMNLYGTSPTELFINKPEGDLTNEIEQKTKC